MKINIKDICAQCALCDKTSIVDFDMNSGNIKVLYYMGECKLGHRDVKEQCAPKEVVEWLLWVVNTYIELIKLIVDTFIEIYDGIKNYILQEGVQEE